LAASSLMLGTALGLVRRWPRQLIGLVLAFGAGALIAAVSFELAQEGVRLGGTTPVAVGLGLGALTYFLLDTAIDRRSPAGSWRGPTGPPLGPALALGAVLDGVPEQAVLGIGLVTGPGASAALLVAVFVSNVPEAVGSAADMRAAGHRAGAIWWLWITVAVVCTAATVGGYALAQVTTGAWTGAIDGFAAGALLVMLVDSMIPAAARRAGPTAGLATVLGFAIAAGLSFTSV
jgi:ZIP family zinc transporter